VARFDGTAWSAVGGGVSGAVADQATFDGGTEPALFVGGFFGRAGSTASRVSPAGATAPRDRPLPAGRPGTPAFAAQARLVPGREHLNLFSFDACPPGPGTGPYLGLCGARRAGAAARRDGPVPLRGRLPLRRLRPLPPPPTLVVEAVSLDVTNALIYAATPVSTLTVQ